jgi:hypothetical protein
MVGRMTSIVDGFIKKISLSRIRYQVACNHFTTVGKAKNTLNGNQELRSDDIKFLHVCLHFFHMKSFAIKDMFIVVLQEFIELDFFLE